MGSYSKKFTNPSNPDDFVFVTWDQAYRNVKVYRNGNVVATADGVSNLMRGVVIEASDLGTVRLGLTNEKPITLTVHIDGDRYYSAKEKTEDQELLKGISLIFWILSFFSAIGFLMLVNTLWDFIHFPGMLAAIVIDGLIVLSYVTSALLCRFTYPAGYYIGTSVLLLTTGLMFLGSGMVVFSGFLTSIFMLVRLGVLIFLLTRITKVIAVRKTSKVSPSDLLDS